jgi:hypothetical protein
VPEFRSSPGWATPRWTLSQTFMLVLTGLLVVLVLWGRIATGTVPQAAGGSEVEAGEAAAGRHFVVVAGGGDTAYLAIGTTEASLPPGRLVSFEPDGLSTSLGSLCPRWDFMARFGGRTVGDTRLVAGTWNDGTTSVGGSSAWVSTRAEPLTWHAACYDIEGMPLALPRFTARIEFVTATPFS